MRNGLILSFLIFFLSVSVANADNHRENDGWKQLNEIADQALQYGKQEKYEEAKKFLESFSKAFLKQTSEKPLSMQELKMVIYSFEQAESAVTDVKLTHDERINKLTGFRLVVDAITSEHQPLWKHARTMVMTPFERAEMALKQDEKDKFQYYVNEFLSKYEVIRPALNVDLGAEHAQKIDSYVRFLENERYAIENDHAKQQRLMEMKEALNDLFEEGKSAESELIDVIYFIGGAIVLTLIYVGWKKYKGEKKEKQSRARDRYRY